MEKKFAQGANLFEDFQLLLEYVFKQANAKETVLSFFFQRK